jgi:hypothetical protein
MTQDVKGNGKETNAGIRRFLNIISDPKPPTPEEEPVNAHRSPLYEVMRDVDYANAMYELIEQHVDLSESQMTQNVKEPTLVTLHHGGCMALKDLRDHLKRIAAGEE